MTMFNERESAFEAKFAHDEEFRFLATARRDKLFAHWAGDSLGVPGTEIEAMTSKVLHLRDGAGHDERVLEHMATVFANHGIAAIPQTLSAALAACAKQAREELLASPHFT